MQRRSYVAAPYAEAAYKAERQTGSFISGFCRLFLAAGVIGGLWLAVTTGNAAKQEPESAYSACIASASTSADYAYCRDNFAGKAD